MFSFNFLLFLRRIDHGVQSYFAGIDNPLQTIPKRQGKCIIQNITTAALNQLEELIPDARAKNRSPVPPGRGLCADFPTRKAIGSITVQLSLIK